MSEEPSFYNNAPSPFAPVLNRLREDSPTTVEIGTRFEHLIQAYFQTDPVYAGDVKRIWMWADFPYRDQLGLHDTGIDLVALTYDGDFWAIQCKCYESAAYIDKGAVDSFLSTSSRTFKPGNGITTRFALRYWVATTDRLSSNAREAMRGQSPPVQIITHYDLARANVDWYALEQGIYGEQAKTPPKKIRDHQADALRAARSYFSTPITDDAPPPTRGKLIMACGTGKTFTALKIAEQETLGTGKTQGFILLLVPSIALLGQSLREWCNDAAFSIHPICICSDAEVSMSKKKNPDDDSYAIEFLARPASTNVPEILKQLHNAKDKDGLVVVFSTYQSIQVIADAQAAFLRDQPSSPWGVFDMIICDEAHRTTGYTLKGEDKTAFLKVHDNTALLAHKRLYMTATPRLYSDDVKDKAAESETLICSMDDFKTYGDEIYRIGFGTAVDKGLLADYKVLVLAINEAAVSAPAQALMARQAAAESGSEQKELKLDDATKLIGCVNALSKRVIGDDGTIRTSDPAPMRKAVAFCQRIADSKLISQAFDAASAVYYEHLTPEQKEDIVNVSSAHVDGTMSATARESKLAWLNNPQGDLTCHVLHNVRCLSEGVDIPTLDAVLFLSAKNSQIDVVQSVGRVMRSAPGKKYGYIIIPIVVPANVTPEEALNDNERYKVVWSVLSALRAHDDRFSATINKIELNKKRPPNISVVGVGGVGGPDSTPEPTGKEGKPKPGEEPPLSPLGNELALQFEQLQDIIYARMVKKVGSRVFWEQWARDIAQIALRHKQKMQELLASSDLLKMAFNSFLIDLTQNINPSVTADDAIDMLSQHIITQPVFEALFENYSFAKSNPVSAAMQRMIDAINQEAARTGSLQNELEQESLQRFYESVRTRAANVDNAEGKQRIIIELYDKFFKTAFPKMVEQLGIVYTPVEVVDFIIHSVQHVLQKEFKRSLTDENLHILDPFTGTGTFITRLLQSGIINPRDLPRKYATEIHANEIVLLAYYIASINIENVYHDLTASTDFQSFNGICLTDTFQLGETDPSEKFLAQMFPENSARVLRQRAAPLRVIIGNPPYSVGQKSANDNAQNQAYPKLDSRVAGTYAAASTAVNKNSLYDSYIKAFRWSTDRLDPNHGGIIAFISNGAWIDGAATAGFRHCLAQEFSAIYVFNLRGNARTQGVQRKKESGNVFASGSRTPIAVTLLVKNPKKAKDAPLAKIFYHDIGDYLSREDKLQIVSDFASIKTIKWQTITPNEHDDWINARDNAFQGFHPLAPDKKFSAKAASFFCVNSRGLETGRDEWLYNFSNPSLYDNIQSSIDFYNAEVDRYASSFVKGNLEVEDFINSDSTKISWTSSLISHLSNKRKIVLEDGAISRAAYRPFCKMMLYMGEKMIHRRGQWKEYFPTPKHENVIITVSGIGGSKDNSTLITNTIIDLNSLDAGTQCFPLYWYEKRKESVGMLDLGLEVEAGGGEYIRRDGVTDYILELARKAYGKLVTKEDIFYYVYGFLHSPDYTNQFANDLKKSLPRLPLVEEAANFWAFSKAGRTLADLHLNYENHPAPEGIIITGDTYAANPESAPEAFYAVEKMRHPSKENKSVIIFNRHIKIEGIPPEAYSYVVNGRTPIAWVMERYQIKTHKESQITNNPNHWASEHNHPRYILDLLLSVINLSLQTHHTLQSLPKWNK